MTLTPAVTLTSFGTEAVSMAQLHTKYLRQLSSQNKEQTGYNCPGHEIYKQVVAQHSDEACYGAQ